MLNGRLQSTIAIAQKNGNSDKPTIGCGCSHVQLAVAIEVSHCERRNVGREGGVVYRRLKGSVAVAQQHTDVGRIGDEQVEDMITIEIPHDKKLIHCRGGEILCRLKSPIAVAQQHTNRAFNVRNHQIDVAIAVEIRRRQR